MKTALKVLVCAFMLISAGNAFASLKPVTISRLNVSAQKSAYLPGLDIYSATDNVIYINIFAQYLGPVNTGSGPRGHYQMFIDLTYNGQVESVPSPYSFTLTLDVTIATGQPAVPINMTISSNQSSSTPVDVYTDHYLTESDATGYTQSATSYNGIPIELNYNASIQN